MVKAKQTNKKTFPSGQSWKEVPDKHPSLCVFSDAAADSYCNAFPIVTILFPSGLAQPPSWLFLLVKLSELTRTGAGTAYHLAINFSGCKLLSTIIKQKSSLGQQEEQGKRRVILTLMATDSREKLQQQHCWVCGSKAMGITTPEQQHEQKCYRSYGKCCHSSLGEEVQSWQDVEWENWRPLAIQKDRAAKELWNNRLVPPEEWNCLS